MKKKAVFILVVLCVLFPAFPVLAEIPTVTAEAAVLIDVESGQVLYDKNMSQKMYPASITKIMTALLTVEACHPAAELTARSSALNLPDYSTSIYLTPGERLLAEDALYALMLHSANDAANVLAEAISGSQESFVKAMNHRALEIGAIDTHFTNAHGLPDDDHYTTAYDMALITREAIESQQFMRYFGSDRYTMSATSLSEAKDLINGQSMLLQESLYYSPEVLGGKVGYTNAAQHTMSTVAERDGRTLICVVMGSSREEKFTDTLALLEFGFEEFILYSLNQESFPVESRLILLDGKYVGSVDFALGQDVNFLLHNSISLQDVEWAYNLPRSFDKEKEISGEAVLRVDKERAEGLVEMIVSVPLEPDITMLAPSGGLLQEITENWVPYLSGELAPSFLWIPAVLAVVALLRLGTKAIGRLRLLRRSLRCQRRADQAT